MQVLDIEKHAEAKRKGQETSKCRCDIVSVTPGKLWLTRQYAQIAGGSYQPSNFPAGQRFPIRIVTNAAVQRKNSAMSK